MPFKVGDIVRYFLMGKWSVGRVTDVGRGEYIVNEGEDDEYLEERDTFKIDWSIQDPWSWGDGKYFEFMCDYNEEDFEVIDWDSTAPD